jgi:hypothetical protein
MVQYVIVAPRAMTAVALWKKLKGPISMWKDWQELRKALCSRDFPSTVQNLMKPMEYLCTLPASGKVTMIPATETAEYEKERRKWWSRVMELWNLSIVIMAIEEIPTKA